MIRAGLLTTIAGVAAIVLAASPGGTASRLPSPAAPRPVGYRAPVDGRLVIVRAFEPPASAYGPGHRGIDLRSLPGAAVRAAGDATVVFAGVVAGRGVVVLAHADGIRTEYEPLRPEVHVGIRVHAGAVIGSVSGRHGTCAPSRCVHWSARRGDVYLDPMTLLDRLGTVHLVPWSP